MDRPTENGVDSTGLGCLLRENLDFHGKDDVPAPHGWHPFPAKFPPQLPRLFINGLTAPGDVVLDPMFGSGTTIVEAARLGRSAVGCDIDPLSRLVAKAKLAPLNHLDALETGTAVVARAKKTFFRERATLEQALADRFRGKTRAFVDYWFLPQQQLELNALLDAIESCAPKPMRGFLHMVFSSTIIAKSGGTSLARDLAHTRPHRVPDKVPKCAFDEFAKRLRTALGGGTWTDAKRPSAKAEIRARSAEDTGMPAHAVDLVVTSPPYANNAIDYMRAHKFSLVWLGWEIEELTNIRARFLGHDAKAEREWPGLPERCERTIARLARVDTRKAAVLRRYFGEMTAVIAEMHRVLKPAGTAVLVVGSSILRGIDVETHRGLAAIGESVGFRLAGIGVRRLDRDKRMMPARWGSNAETKKTQIEHRMHEEHVIGLMK